MEADDGETYAYLVVKLDGHYESGIGDVVPVPDVVAAQLGGKSVMLSSERGVPSSVRRHDVLVAKTEDQAKKLAEEYVGDTTHTVVAQVKLRSKKRRAGSATAAELLDPIYPEYWSGQHKKKAVYMVIPRAKDDGSAVGTIDTPPGGVVPWIKAAESPPGAAMAATIDEAREIARMLQLQHPRWKCIIAKVKGETSARVVAETRCVG
jgi:hypothetical protein